MTVTETLEEFYRHKFSGTPSDIQQEIGDFNVFDIEETVTPGGEVTIKYARRDFYKISLITGENLFHYADKTLHVKGSSLMFFNPRVPYRWEAVSKENSGYFCIFKDAFFVEKLRSSFCDLPMFAIGGKPSYILDEEQTAFAAGIFRKMIAEVNSGYRFKQDLLVSYVTELIHFAMKMEATETLFQPKNANGRIAAVFNELLERQFPIASTRQRFELRSAKDYADQLCVHVNHLNRAVKETTGKTTTALIAERLACEAKALLKNTDWPVAEIGYCLGFEEPAHFNTFFKKLTETTPSRFRNAG
ncbi:AraC-like DNA-binding protein [Filimonas zeae]|uniref:AraC family transcriptional regulator n=1 Tax=Filimonas zeae TaxID=1737353 RepID=A0A917IW79_9BACT|nr:helix-turn-helix domain-containing protein [Filimonas zeae]MDR6339231.1 AraC-like DNA-binding protein [Filimonas zeae]GGH64511.1 AraC family transcriptional regulator [Filimonas zeae]